MTDRLTPEERRENMSRIRGKNTTPEMRVRRSLHELGYRFRLHVKGLPGTPDVVFTKRHKIIQVHGCYWHRHPGCKYANKYYHPFGSVHDAFS